MRCGAVRGNSDAAKDSFHVTLTSKGVVLRPGLRLSIEPSRESVPGLPLIGNESVIPATRLAGLDSAASDSSTL